MQSIGVAKSVDLTGGESVYCINEAQLAAAKRLAEGNDESSARIASAIRELEATLSRNERATVAFLLIERLRTSGQ